MGDRFYELSKGINVKKAYRRMEELIEQHGEVRVVFATTSYMEGKYDLRIRSLKKDGQSVVAYKSADYDNYSSFHPSCFVAGQIRDHKKTLQLMKEHDGRRIVPVALFYGPEFTNRIVMGKKWEHINNCLLKIPKTQSLVRRILKLKDHIMQRFLG